MHNNENTIQYDEGLEVLQESHCGVIISIEIIHVTK